MGQIKPLRFSGENDWILVFVFVGRFKFKDLTSRKYLIIWDIRNKITLLTVLRTYQQTSEQGLRIQLVGNLVKTSSKSHLQIIMEHRNKKHTHTEK